MSKTSQFFTGILVGVVSIVLIALIVSPRASQDINIRGAVDSNRIGINTETTTIVSSTVQKVCSVNSARVELTISNYSTNATNTISLFLNSTSAGASATSGIILPSPTSGGSGRYSPDFGYTGAVFAISNQTLEASVGCSEGTN